MRRIVYRSRATMPFDAAALDRLAVDASLGNLPLDVTGVLWFGGGCFVQLLEGPDEALGGLVARIAADPRHDRFETLLDEPASTRWAAVWTMALGTTDDLPPPMRRFVPGAGQPS